MDSGAFQWFLVGILLFCLCFVFYRRAPHQSLRILLSSFMGGVAGLLAGFLLAAAVIPFVGLAKGTSHGWTGFSGSYVFNALFFGLGSLFSLVGVFIGLAIGRKSL